jgi:iron complex outermembrane receptor protein
MSIHRPIRASVRFAAAAGSSAAFLFHGAALAAEPNSSIETVVVSASPITPEDKLATIVDTVDRDEILRAGGANLADALANTPGVTGTSFASGASRPVIRGFDANRVRILEDGIGSFDVAEVGPDHGVPIDPLSAQRIEVIRGAATLRYGSQAIGGVINAINNRVPNRRPDEPFAAEFTGLYGSNADTWQGSAVLDARAGDFGLHADAFTRDTGDYDVPGGTMANSFFQGSGYSAGGSYFFDQNRIGAALVRYDSEYGIPGEENFIDMKQDKQLLRASFSPGIGAFQTLNVEGGRADYEHHERDPATLEPHATFRDDEWDARAEALFGKVGAFSAAALGVQLQNRAFSALGEAEDYLLPATTKTAAVFAFADLPLAERLHLHAGARVDSIDTEGTPADGVATTRSFTPLSASAGLLFDATGALSLGMTLASAARAPAQTELFARGPHEGSGTFETGDPTLGVERANSLEATLRYELPGTRLEAALWTADFDDYVFGALTGRSCDEDGNCFDGDAGDLRELNYEQRDARFRGAEAKATIDVVATGAGTLQAIALADYVRATLAGGENVPRIPPYHVGAGLNWDASSVSAGFLLRYAGEQDQVGEGETPTDDFYSLDAQASWRPLQSQPDFEIALVGRNLTDEVQRNAVSLNKDEVMLPGREVRLMIRAAL